MLVLVAGGARSVGRPPGWPLGDGGSLIGGSLIGAGATRTARIDRQRPIWSAPEKIPGCVSYRSHPSPAPCPSLASTPRQLCHKSDQRSVILLARGWESSGSGAWRGLGASQSAKRGGQRQGGAGIGNGHVHLQARQRHWCVLRALLAGCILTYTTGGLAVGLCILGQVGGL